MSTLFLFSSPLPIQRSGRRCSVCERSAPRANINQTSNSGREDEIAAKIASLRKMKRLKNQRGSSPPRQEDANNNKPKENATTVTSFDELPDWKKEEILQGQMAEAEAFFTRGSTTSPASSPSTTAQTPAPSISSSPTPDDYKPKVSTWGVFPRPDNISKTFGGGKRIKPGGVDLSSPSSQEQDALITDKLASYRASRGIDTAREEAHAGEISDALAASSIHMTHSRPYEAVRTLQAVEPFVSERSRRGGQVFLALALAYEAVGKRDEARDLYRRLRRSPFPEVSTKAKQLVQGFEAMELLKVEDETRERGFRVTDFSLPDVAAGVERRYETVVSTEGGGGKAEPLSLGTSLLLLLLIAGPVAFVLLVLGPASR